MAKTLAGLAAEANTAEEFIERKCEQWEGERGKRSKRLVTKDVGRKAKQYWVRDKWTLVRSHDHKVFTVERIVLDETRGTPAYGADSTGDVQYRIAYWIVGRIGKAKDRWVFGGFCPMVPADEFAPLLKQARDEGTILEEGS
jgi:hypothetical protein